MSLPRAHTHPTHKPLSSLRTSNQPQPRKALTALPTPLSLSPRKLFSSRPALASPPAYEGNDDPFGCVDFFGGREGEWSWVKEEVVEVRPEDDEEGRLDGEDEDGLEECARRLIAREDRFGVLGLRAPTLPELTATRTPSPLSASPPTPPIYAQAVPPHQVDDHLPPTDDALHNTFAARSRAVSYPSLAALSLASAQPSNPKRPQAKRANTGMRSAPEREKARTESQAAGGELGLFFDPVAEEDVTKGGWRVWALERASRIVGLE